MTLTMYINSSDHRVGRKNIETIGTIDYVLKEPSDVLTPTLTLKGFDRRCNYVAIDDLYYYVTSIVLEHGNLYTVSLDIDVLMSYYTDICKCEALIYRQGVHKNPLLSDTLLLSQTNEITVNRAFEGCELSNQLGASANNFVLMTYGGVVTGGDV